MLSVGDVGGDDAGVAGLKFLGVLVEVLVGGDELALVVAAAVADDDLGGVLIGHDDGGLGESASEGVGVVGLEGLLEHAGVEVVSDLELVLGEGGHLGEPLRVQVHRLRGPIIKSQAHVLPVFLQDLAARRHLRVLEHRRRLGPLRLQLRHRQLQLFCKLFLDFLLLFFLLFKNLF